MTHERHGSRTAFLAVSLGRAFGALSTKNTAFSTLQRQMGNGSMDKQSWIHLQALGDEGTFFLPESPNDRFPHSNKTTSYPTQQKLLDQPTLPWLLTSSPLFFIRRCLRRRGVRCVRLMDGEHAWGGNTMVRKPTWRLWCSDVQANSSDYKRPARGFMRGRKLCVL